MDHECVFNEFVHKSVKTGIVEVEADDQESVDRADGVIWLNFFNVSVICSHKYERARKKDIGQS